MVMKKLNRIRLKGGRTQMEPAFDGMLNENNTITGRGVQDMNGLQTWP